VICLRCLLLNAGLMLLRLRTICTGILSMHIDCKCRFLCVFSVQNTFSLQSKGRISNLVDETIAPNTKPIIAHDIYYFSLVTKEARNFNQKLRKNVYFKSSLTRRQSQIPSRIPTKYYFFFVML